MDSYRRIAALKIQAAQDRTHAVTEEVTHVENKVYVSPGSRNILRFVRDAALRIEGLLEEQKPIVSSGPLTASQLETRLNRTTKLLPVLHQLVGFVEGSDVHRSPGSTRTSPPPLLAVDSSDFRDRRQFQTRAELLNTGYRGAS